MFVRKLPQAKTASNDDERTYWHPASHKRTDFNRFVQKAKRRIKIDAF